MSKSWILTKQEKDNIINSYQSGISGYKLAKQNGVTKSTIYNLLERENINTRSRCDYHKYNINENYFDNIDHEDKAYILGLLYADGYNNEKNRSIHLSLEYKDKEILDKIKDKLQFNGYIKLYHSSPPYKNHINANLTICNNKISSKLSELGCYQNKSLTLEFPVWLDPCLYRHFIRGYTDGDGSIIIDKRKRIQYSLCGTKKFLTKVHEILKNNTSCKGGIYNCSSTKLVNEIRLMGNIQVKRVLNWLYKDATIYLNRKYNKYLQAINI